MPLFSHVVYKAAEENPRYLFAKESWKNAGIHTLFYSETVERGQNLVVPLFNDIIEKAFHITGATFLLYTNSDIALVKETMEELEPYLIDGNAYYVPNKQVKGFDRFFGDSADVAHLPEPKWGADTFLISRKWWQEKSKFFADFLIGYPCWDDVLIDLIGTANRLPNIAYHEEHASYWKSSDAAFDLGLLHNIENAGFNSLAICIPFYCESLSSLRLRNLLFVLRKLREKWNGPVFIGLQQSSVAGEIRHLLKRFNVRCITPSYQGLSNKSMLTNEAVGEALKFYPFSYVLQLDADLYSPNLGGLIWNWVRGPQVDASFIYSDFFFLTRRLTEVVVRGEKLEVDTKKLYKPTGFGPGGFLVSTKFYQKVGGMPEQFVGWGLEDTAFGDALKAAGAQIQECRLPAFHLYHENDRHINRESFQRTMRFNEGTFEECKYLASDKVAIFEYGGYGSWPIADLLNAQEETFICFSPEFSKVAPTLHKYLRECLVNEISSEERYKLLGFATNTIPSEALVEHLIRRDYSVIVAKTSDKEVPKELEKLLAKTCSLVIDLDYFDKKAVRELEKLLRLKMPEFTVEEEIRPPGVETLWDDLDFIGGGELVKEQQ